MIFVDATVFFDYVGQGKSWQESYVILNDAQSGENDYYVSVLSIIFLHMHLFKYHNEAARDEIKELTKGFTIIPITTECYNLAIENMSMEDFEDCVQYYSAKSIGCQTIITTNNFDYKAVSDDIEVLKPREYIEKKGLGI